MKHLKEYTSYLKEHDESYNKSHPAWYIVNINRLIRREAENLIEYMPEGWTFFNTQRPHRPVCLTDGKMKVFCDLVPDGKDGMWLGVEMPYIPTIWPPEMKIEGIFDRITGFEQEDSKMIAKECIELISKFIEKGKKRKRSVGAFGSF